MAPEPSTIGRPRAPESATLADSGASGDSQPPDQRLPVAKDGSSFRQRLDPLRVWVRRHHTLAAVLAYLGAALYVTVQLWISPGDMTVIGPGRSDTLVFEWFMAHGARVITDLENPFFTDQINTPLGVNMIANTSTLGLSIPLAPVTLLFGPIIAVLVAMVLCLAGTASAWYYVLSRHIVTSRIGAFVGAAFCGFAPAMISQAAGHVNFIAQFLLPLLVLRVIKLGRPGKVLWDTAVLSALVVWQVFLNQELLLFTAMGCLVLTVVWATANRDRARERFRPAVATLGLTAVVSLAVLTYPFYVQFFGRQSYTSLPVDPGAYYADVASYFLFSSESLAGDRMLVYKFAPNPSEENTFFGFPLMVLLLVLAIWLWRFTAARAATIIAVIFGSISLGREVVIWQWHTGIPGPYWILSKLPLFHLSLPSRYALVVVPMAGILVAAAFDHIHAVRWTRRVISTWKPHYVLGAVVAVALVPAAPTPLADQPAPVLPNFVTSGAWRSHVADGGTVLGVPIASGMPWAVATLRWSSVTNMDMVMPGGYFLGPTSETDRSALFTSPPRPTSDLLDSVARSGVGRYVDDTARANMIEDLRYWNTSVVVLGRHANQDELAFTLESLLGRPGQPVDDVLIWDVRAITQNR
jgi:hypothetical protein